MYLWHLNSREYHLRRTGAICPCLIHLYAFHDLSHPPFNLFWTKDSFFYLKLCLFVTESSSRIKNVFVDAFFDFLLFFYILSNKRVLEDRFNLRAGNAPLMSAPLPRNPGRFQRDMTHDSLGLHTL